jgi:predicted  nucleic acid-binding Zn-ribbon protein
MQYPILAGLFVLLLVLYIEHHNQQKKLAGDFQGKIDRLQHEIEQIANDLRKMSEKPDTVGKQFVGLQHELTSVSNQLGGMKEHHGES